MLFYYLFVMLFISQSSSSFFSFHLYQFSKYLDLVLHCLDEKMMMMMKKTTYSEHPYSMRLITGTRNELPVTQNNNNHNKIEQNKLEPSASTCKHTQYTCTFFSTSFIDVIQYILFYLYLFGNGCMYICVCVWERKSCCFLFLFLFVLLLLFLDISWWTIWSMDLSLFMTIHWSVCCDELIKLNVGIPLTLTTYEYIKCFILMN